MSTTNGNAATAITDLPTSVQRVEGAWHEQLAEARAITRHAMRRVKREETKAMRLDGLATLLGALATVLAASAAMTAAGGYGSGWITASCAFASALISGLVGRFHPAKTAQHLRAESIHWYDLIDEAKRFDRYVRLHARPLSATKVEHRLHALQRKRDQALTAAVAGENEWLSQARHCRHRRLRGS